ncbi:MAG: molybdenum cofactor biosynthesis protein MoaE, partial [Pseudomonadales bacterium]
MMLFTLNDAPIDAAALNQLLQADAAGACAIFEGRVRNHNDGRDVERLEYEAWNKLAHREGARIIAQAVSRFGLERGFCVHRTGKLE